MEDANAVVDWHAATLAVRLLNIWGSQQKPSTQSVPLQSRR